MLGHKVVEIEKEEVKAPFCDLVAKGFDIKWQ